MGLMITLGAYIRRTGIPREHRDDGRDDTRLDEPGGDPRRDEPGGLLIAVPGPVPATAGVARQWAA